MALVTYKRFYDGFNNKVGELEIHEYDHELGTVEIVFTDADANRVYFTDTDELHLTEMIDMLHEARTHIQRNSQK